MKLSEQQLRQVIKEKFDNLLGEHDSDVIGEYPEHYKFLQDVMEKGYVGDKRSEKYMTLLMWLENGRVEGLEAIDEWDARKLIDAAREESNRARWERDRKWKEENPDTRTPEKRQADADRGEAAYHEANPTRSTYGT